MPIRKKNLRVRVRAQIASKVREKDLLEKARTLMEDPEIVLPDCDQECGSCPFKRSRRRLQKIAKHKDDPAMLSKLAVRGDKLGRAVAATIGLAHEEKAPYLASATYPAGTVLFALRGRAPKEKLIAVQNFDSPKWRALGVLDLVKKKGLHFYSFDDEFICTGKRAAPPLEYIDHASESVGATKRDGNTYSCPHEPATVNHLEFEWVSQGKRIVLCESCAFKSRNTLAKLSEGMAVPNVLNEIEVSIVRPVKTAAGKVERPEFLNRRVSADLLERYSRGEIGDRDLVEKHMTEVREDAEKENFRAYVRGDRYYGDDAVRFAKDIAQDEVEAKALLGLLKGVNHPVIVESGESVNKVLAKYWTEHGKDALAAVLSEKAAERYFVDDEETRKSPMRLIRNAIKSSEQAVASSRIPSYSGLSRYGSYVDQLVKAYKTKGSSAALALLDSEKSSDHRTRSISHAFYLALGITTKSWKFTDEEKAYGKHLEAAARKLLESDGPDAHHAAFTEFLRDAGDPEEVKRIS